MDALRSAVRALALTVVFAVATAATAAPEPATSPAAPTVVVAPPAPRPPAKPAAKAAPKPTPKPGGERVAGVPPPAARPAVKPTVVAIAKPVAPPVAAAPALASGARLAPAQPMPPAELEAFVDGVVRQAMARDHIAGVTVSVVQSGQVLLKKGYGFASLAPYRPVDPDLTLFRLGSISKTFTWILVLKEVEAGHMRLDAPINLYLPEALRVPDEGFRQPVRVRDLMDHTPGFEDRSAGQLFEKDFRRVRPLSVYLQEERPKRVREPGVLVSYSNYGAGLAGAAAVEVTGKPYEQLVESEITGPLGLTRTTFREPHPVRRDMPAPMSPTLARDVSDNYRWTAAGFQQRPFEFLEHIAPAGALSSTAGDMSRYMLMMIGAGTLDGATIYGPATAQAFATPLPRPAPGVPAWRHGLVETALPGGFTGVGHEGATLSFYSNMQLVPDLGLGIFVSTNTDTGQPLASTLPARIVGRFYAPPPGAPPPGDPALTDIRGAYEGAYLTDRRAYRGLEGFVFRLIGASTVRVTRDGRLLTTGMGGTQRWSPVGSPSGGQFVGEDGYTRLVFQMQDGRARRYFAPWGGVAFERIGFVRQAGALIVLTLITAIACVAVLAGLLARGRRDYRETSAQGRSALVQTSQAGLWLLAMLLFGLSAIGSDDIARVMYDWPGAPLILASACALVAAIMTLPSLILLPFVWRGGRRVESWTAGRKLRFTFTALVFLSYAVFLASWGALEPWSG